ncbi:MAG TPA: hypothetical protein VER37_03450, partial [Thermomicrobiales bacterium]|nr:hypothetical protein [Thermomicrobiales bacterium]
MAIERTHRVRGAPVEPGAVVAEQDWPGHAFPDGKVDGPGRPEYQGDDGRLVALAGNTQCPVPSLEAETLDVGRACLADPQTIQPEEDGQRSMGMVDPLGGEEERPELGAVEASGVVRVDLGSADVLRRVGGDPTVDVGEAVVAADGGQPPVDGRRREA